MKRNTGAISVVEIIMIVMVMGLVAAVALPRLSSMQRDTVLSKESLDMVKSSYAAAIADLMTFPNNDELKEYVDASRVRISEDGDSILFSIEATDMRVSTYSDGDCTMRTSSMYQPVQCIGDISLVDEQTN